jgi:DNA polymerase-1
VHVSLERRGDNVALIDDGGGVTVVPERELAAAVAEREAEHPRWVWTDTRHWYPGLIAAGIRVDRCHDLRLVDAILAGVDGRSPRVEWGSASRPEDPNALFEVDAGPDAHASIDVTAVFTAQREAIAAQRHGARLSLLCAAESAGALAAVEMHHCGLPWDAAAHDALLRDALGPRPAAGRLPAQLEQLSAEVAAALGRASVSIDSPAELIKALRGAGIEVSTTRARELQQFDHPVIAPLIQYKTLSRLYTANGWNWLDEWVRDGRFRPTFVPGGVVTGRWASDGGGALQLPKDVRPAVRADEGWALVVADAAQLEPRILAAMSHDSAMARAGAGADLYDGIVSTGAVSTREHAKVGMLGAMYGGTTGVSAQVLPRLARSFPEAIGFVEAAARAGERGERVSTHLGRTSPAPGALWSERQLAGAADGAREVEARAARSEARSWGRFTRNFVVQGTAAEWALAWMAGVRRRLFDDATTPLEQQPHLVFFVHDELVVHAPLDRITEVEQALRAAAVEAGELLFGTWPVTFPISVAAVDRYSNAK